MIQNVILIFKHAQKAIFSLLTAAVLAGSLTTAAVSAPALQDGPTDPKSITAPEDWIWSRQRVDAPRLFYDMTNHSMRVDSSGYAHIAYGGDHLYYARYDGTDWIITTVNSAFGVGEFASLALDKDKRPHISYYDQYNGRLKYAAFDGTNWLIAVVDQPPPAEAALLGGESLLEESPSLAEPLGHGERLNPSLQEDSGSSGEQAASSFPGVGLYSSIAVDSDGFSHISYFDQITRDLKYATNTSGQWVTTYVDTKDKVGLYTSIAVDSKNRPHISYFDETYDDLKYAHYNGSSWSKTLVDSGDYENDGGDDIVGGYSSIAVDANRKSAHQLLRQLARRPALRYPAKRFMDAVSCGQQWGCRGLHIDRAG